MTIYINMWVNQYFKALTNASVKRTDVPCPHLIRYLDPSYIFWPYLVNLQYTHQLPYYTIADCNMHVSYSLCHLTFSISLSTLQAYKYIVLAFDVLKSYYNGAEIK